MPLCPKCGHEVAKTDTHCMDCGTDLLAEREKERDVLRQMSMAARIGSGQHTVAGASSGTMAVGEKSAEETRIRAFDAQEAERMVQERTTSWVSAGIALVFGVALVLVALSRIKAGGGFDDLTDILKPKAFRNLSNLGSPLMLGFLLLGLGVSGLLIAFGQIRLAMSTTRAIAQVRENLRPDIVQVSRATILGLFVLCIFCPPIGILIGLLMRFGRNPDLRPLGSRMVQIAVGIMVLFAGNMLFKLGDGLKTVAPPSH